MENKYTHPIDLLVHSTIRIVSETNSGPSIGTGYYFNFAVNDKMHVPCIVTNKHVISGSIKGKFYLNIKNSDGSFDAGKHIHLEFDNFESSWIKHPDNSVDLAIFPIAPIITDAQNKNIALHYTPLIEKNIASDELLSTLPTMEEIIMIGYPIGIWDEKHNLPIIRKGITATHPRLPYNGKPEFLIDAACFPGSSGSPVFLVNIGGFVNEKGSVNLGGTRIALLGTLYAGPQYTIQGKIETIEIPIRTESVPISTSTIPINLGFVIHAAKLNDFNEILKDVVKC